MEVRLFEMLCQIGHHSSFHVAHLTINLLCKVVQIFFHLGQVWLGLLCSFGSFCDCGLIQRAKAVRLEMIHAVHALELTFELGDALIHGRCKLLLGVGAAWWTPTLRMRFLYRPSRTHATRMVSCKSAKGSTIVVQIGSRSLVDNMDVSDLLFVRSNGELGHLLDAHAQVPHLQLNCLLLLFLRL